jgi:hypothetical protein
LFNKSWGLAPAFLFYNKFKMAKITVPLEIIEIDKGSYHIFTLATINNKECDILIDTGASRTVFDKKYISAHPIDMDADAIVSSGLGAGSLDTLVGILDNFSIGGHSWKKSHAIFMDFSHINGIYKKMSKKRIAGLVGGDFLFRTKAKIDYSKAQVTFYIPSRKKNIFG